MYSPAEFAPLSQASLKRLLKGNTVRVQHGSGLKLHLSKAQMKKHMSSKKKGKGYNLTLDPYQSDMMGKGFFEDIGSAFKSFGDTVNKEVIQPIAQEGEKYGKELASALIHEGIPAVGSTLGGVAGATLGGLTANPLLAMGSELAGSQLGQYGGTKLADYIGQKTGYGLMDMLKPLIPIAKKAIIAVGKEVASEVGKQVVSKGLDYAQKRALEYGVPPEVIKQSEKLAYEVAKNPKSIDLKKVDAEAMLKEIVEGPLQKHPLYEKVQEKMKEMFGHGIKKAMKAKKAPKKAPKKAMKMKGGTALIDQPFTVREAVDATGKFFQNPAGTLGFGMKDVLMSAKMKEAMKPKIHMKGGELSGGRLLIDEPITIRQAVNSTGKFFKDPVQTIGFGTMKGHNGGALIDTLKANRGGALLQAGYGRMRRY